MSLSGTPATSKRARADITVALAGNPNAGKTTIFNNLTGARQHVANYPGVTVDKKEGFCRHRGVAIRVVDLPGTYSLTAHSEEELIARAFVVEEKPDLVVDVLDASNLERNLYLTTQFMELGVPLVLALTMSDIARSRGIAFDLVRLSQLLGAPIVPLVGNKGLGTEALLDAILAVASGEAFRPVTIAYGREIEGEIAKLQKLVERATAVAERYGSGWLALKLREEDPEVERPLDAPEIREAARRGIAYLETIFGEPPAIVIAGLRYGFISGACQEAVKASAEIRHSMSDSIDAVLTNRILGLPAFFGLMYLVFYLTFTVGRPPMDWIEAGFAWLAGRIEGAWPAPGAFKSLIVDGIIGGVGGVIVFLPNILLLFLAIALLEDSGYMARAAFIMDRVMRKIGLHGKSFIAMLIGFGCTVPAIMATRTLESRFDRMATMMVMPLMSCGARLTIYALFIPAFFPESLQAPILWSMYLIGIALAIAGAKLLRSTVFKSESTPFVMELPPYRMPTLKGIFLHMWRRGWLYLRKAGTVILGISIVLWFLTSYPRASADRLAGLTPEQARQARLEHSLAGRIGRAMEPLLEPMGFDWQLGTAFVGAFAAKEVFVAQLGIVYANVEEAPEAEGRTSLREELRRHYSPLVAFCIMLFCLIGSPCMATVAVMRRESNSWGWALVQFAGLTLLAFALTTATFQIGSLIGIGV